MTFFEDNLFWMAFNAILALVPVLLVVFLRLRLSRIVHLIFFFLWLIFLPNTIYLITDLQHLPNQLIRAGMVEQVILIFQFVILAVMGVMTYIYSLEPASTIFKKMKIKEMKREVIFIILNYIVAFGVILGKVQRTHSWYIFTEPQRVVSDIIATLQRADLLVWVFIMGTIINALFFLFKDYFAPLRKVIRKKN